MTLQEALQLAQTAQAAATVAALIVGGAWTYFLFVRQRLRFAAASISHEVTVVQLSDDHVLVHVAATVANRGKVLLSLESAEARLQQVVPFVSELAEVVNRGEDPVKKDQYEVDWPPLGLREWTWKQGEAEIEPGEEDVLHCDFIVDSGVQRAVLYTYIRNRQKLGRQIGWCRETFESLDPPANVAQGSNSHATET